MTVSSSVLDYKNTMIVNTSLHKVTWQGLLFFELKSFIGRHFLKKRKLKINTNQINLLNLGSGLNPIHDHLWINADFFNGFLPGTKPFHANWMVDLRYPLPCPDNIWDGIFSEHTLEHLYPDEAFKLLRELNRTMKSQAWLRITVPDLQQYVDYYEGRPVNPDFFQWKTGGEAIHTLTQNYYHLSVWNEQLLSEFLNNAGFTQVQKVSFRQGTDTRLCQDREGRRWETVYMEAQKP
jgi:predicted SAM-dependent methyltransferase